MGSRESILNKIKIAREAKGQIISVVEEPVASGLKVPEGDLAVAFKNNIELVQGECHLSDNQDQCLVLIKQYLSEHASNNQILLSPSLNTAPFNSLNIDDDKKITTVEIGISTCELLVAQTGTVLVTSKEGRRIIGLSPIHIIIAKRSQLRCTLDEGVKELAQKYGENLPSQITLVTGPSRTADIEKTLILGAHGPKKLIVFIY